jgi:hypothetical protein
MVGEGGREIRVVSITSKIRFFRYPLPLTTTHPRPTQLLKGEEAHRSASHNLSVFLFPRPTCMQPCLVAAPRTSVFSIFPFSCSMPFFSSTDNLPNLTMIDRKWFHLHHFFFLSAPPPPPPPPLPPAATGTEREMQTNKDLTKVK